MLRNLKNLRRQQLDRFFENAQEVLKSDRPKQGWIKEIREALGMSMQDLASRMGVIGQRVNALEKAELTGKVTLESLQKAADAMDCEIVYFAVPKSSLENTIEAQKKTIANIVSKEVEKTMALENQNVTGNGFLHLAVATDSIEQLSPRHFWKFKK
jgi:predicted DNA-binding mobile mystery protein A